MLSRATRQMATARERDGRPIGQLFGDAVRSSLQSMLFIGGCIMMFSVFIRILTVSGLVDAVASALMIVLAPLGFDADLVMSLIKGTVEITVGAEAVSRAAEASLLHKVTLTSGIIAWSGLSVHAQVAAMIHGTGIRLAPYLAARFLHAVLAAGFAWLFMGPLEATTTAFIQPVFAPLVAAQGISGFWNRLGSSLTIVVTLTGLLAAISAGLSLKRRVVGVWVRR